MLASRYAAGGRTSIPPERLLSASLLQVVYSVRSERLLMEQLDYNLLIRWFVWLEHRRSGLGPLDVLVQPRALVRCRDRAALLRAHGVAGRRLRDLVSDEHFSVDGTLLEAWASHKSFRPKDGDDDSDGGDFHGQKRSTRRTPRRPIRMRAWSARAKARRRN